MPRRIRTARLRVTRVPDQPRLKLGRRGRRFGPPAQAERHNLNITVLPVEVRQKGLQAWEAGRARDMDRHMIEPRPRHLGLGLDLRNKEPALVRKLRNALDSSVQLTATAQH